MTGILFRIQVYRRYALQLIFTQKKAASGKKRAGIALKNTTYK
ncbi:hypothetical protein [Chitinophaga polysaccharea]|nr:hypothetical protein [Chitinophaga polysaccharea]